MSAKMTQVKATRVGVWDYKKEIHLGRSFKIKSPLTYVKNDFSLWSTLLES